jgi:hypothetical protein
VPSEQKEKKKKKTKKNPSLSPPASYTKSSPPTTTPNNITYSSICSLIAILKQTPASNVFIFKKSLNRFLHNRSTRWRRSSSHTIFFYFLNTSYITTCISSQSLPAALL